MQPLLFKYFNIKLNLFIHQISISMFAIDYNRIHLNIEFCHVFCRQLSDPDRAEVTYNVNYDSPVEPEDMAQSANVLAAALRGNENALPIGGENVPVLGIPELVTEAGDGSENTSKKFFWLICLSGKC